RGRRAGLPWRHGGTSHASTEPARTGAGWDAARAVSSAGHCPRNEKEGEDAEKGVSARRILREEILVDPVALAGRLRRELSVGPPKGHAPPARPARKAGRPPRDPAPSLPRRTPASTPDGTARPARPRPAPGRTAAGRTADRRRSNRDIA